MRRLVHACAIWLHMACGRRQVGGVLAACVLCVAAGEVHALKEFRNFSKTWRLYGVSSGDFDSPEAAIQAVNDHAEAQYSTCIAQNCGQCSKVIQDVPSALGPYPSIYNGELISRQVTSSQVTTYIAQCVVNGNTVREASGPTTKPAAGTSAVLAIMRCPVGWTTTTRSLGNQVVSGRDVPAYEMYCVRSIPEPCNVCTNVGNPIEAAIGAKRALETDYDATEKGLSVRRSYSSLIGPWKWEHDFSLKDFTGPSLGSAHQTDLVAYVDAVPAGFYGNAPAPAPQLTPHTFSLVKTQWDTGQAEAWAFLPNQRRIRFTQGSEGSLSTTDSSKAKLTPAADLKGAREWLLNLPDQGFSVFDAGGRLIKKVDFNGSTIDYQRQGSTLTVSSRASGRQIMLDRVDASAPIFGYDRVTLPDGSQLHYQMDKASLVKTVVFPDQTTKGYLYNEAGLTGGTRSASWLTGAIDENGVRRATYAYNGTLASSTELAGGVSKFSLVYSSAHASVTLPPAGVTRNYYWQTDTNGERRVTSISQSAGAGHAAATKTMAYDAEGNIASVNNFSGKRTCFSSDLARGTEIVRVEGLATSHSCVSVTGSGSVLPVGSRKVSTEWHPDWRLTTKVAEPGRITTSVYNGKPDPFAGNATTSCAPSTALLPDGKPIAVLCRRVEQATTDANGSQGFSAALQPGVANRVSTWTYNQWGQVLTENGPRTDVNDTTTYTYYSDTSFTGEGTAAVGHFMGDLATVTNAAGKVTTYTQYNKHGQVLESVDPNGVVTSHSYDLRQRLLSTTVGSGANAQTTAYQYDPVGQLKRVTLPDMSWIGYDYDDAHRQVAVYDHKGNRTDYTLDNAGNRTGETTKDPNGALKRQLARSIDALGRVQQTTGRE